MSLGDQVIVLDENGQITSQGSAETVSAPNLSIQEDQSGKSIPAPPKEEEDDAEVWQEIDMLINPATEENRHAGDMKIYAYYANIAGWWIIGIYLFACCTFVFGVTFPCKSFLASWRINSNLHSCLDSMVDKCKCRSPE